MRPRVRAAALLAAALLAAGCAREAPEHRYSFLAMGTVVELTLHGAPAGLAERAHRALEADFTYMERTWHAWRPGALGRVNTLLATGHWFSAAPSVLPLIVEARALAEASGGLFDPGIGKLIALWGFHGDDPGGERPPPDAARIAALLAARPSILDLEVRGIRVRSRNPEVQLDFGAFAKGLAVDRAVERLRRLGVTSALVNAGGDLRVLGRHGDRPWRIGIRAPRGNGILAALEVADGEAVFTSGDYERYFTWQGRRYHHILDPRTGRPARGLVSVTVVHDDGSEADAAATALFVAGPREWPAVAARLGLTQVLVVDEAGRLQATPALARRLRIVARPAPPLETVPLPAVPEGTAAAPAGGGAP